MATANSTDVAYVPQDEFEKGELSATEGVIRALIRPTLDGAAIHDVPRELVAAALMNVAREFENDARQSLEEFCKRAAI